MMQRAPPERDTESRVLVCAPGGADCRVLAELLESEGIAPNVCADAEAFATQLRRHPDAAIVTDEALGPRSLDQLIKALRSQPPWSDVPLIVLMLAGRDPARLIRQLWAQVKTRIIVLERPLASATLMAAVQVALQSRHRQYQIRDELEHRRAVERTLQARTEALQEEDRNKDLFLATLGHELRNPLAALDLELKLLEDGAEDIDRIHFRMADHVGQLTALVNDLLEVSRVSRGKIRLRRTRTDLVSVVQLAAGAHQRAIAAKQQTLVLTLPPTLILDGDATRLTQIVSNLLSNASKYTPSGGRIEIRAHHENDRAVVVVEDSGKGLRPDQRESIFEPFVQEDPLDGGLGIGLPLVKGLVELHGGSVGVQSPGRGKGASFEVSLPIGDLSGAVRRAQDRSITPLPRFLRVLIIDDNRAFCDSLGALLRRMGASAVCAYDGSDGLEKASTWGPDVAVIDIGLPDTTGYEVARKIRARSEGTGPLLIAVTGFGDEGSKENIRRAGFDAGLVKPIDPQQLRALLARSASRQGETHREDTSLS